MANDWNKPDLNSLKASWLSETRGLATAAAKMDYTGDTNLPTGVLRYVTTTKRVERWNGSSWDFVDIVKDGESISAAGSDQAGATAISAQIVNVSGGSGGVRLPATVEGLEISVYVTASLTCNVYPPSGSTIGVLSANLPLAIIGPGAGKIFKAYGGTAWAHFG